MFQYVKEQIVDEVFISVPYETGDSLAEVVNRFEDMGATVHVTIEILNKFDDYHKTFNMLGNIPVVTFSNQSYDWKMLMIKRVMDIAGSIVGLVITAVVTVFLAPPLLIESPGPLFSHRSVSARMEDFLRSISSVRCIRMQRNAKRTGKPE